jgi:hypothetical protein
MISMLIKERKCMDASNALVPQLSQTLQVSFSPTNFKEAMEFCEYLAKSTFIPKEYVGHPENIFVAMQHGNEIGLQPMQSLASIAVINGKPSIYGDAALAVVKGHRAFEWIKEVYDEAKVTYTCTVKRKGEPEVTQTFSKKDAEVAGLWGKGGPWSNAPKRMLQFRARGFALRDSFPDALKGIITVEEARDYVTIDSATISSGAAAEGVKVEGGAQAEKVEAVAVISLDQAKEFYHAYKRAGYSPAEAKAKLKEVADVEDSRQMPADKLEALMIWANTAKSAEAAK